VRAVTVAPGPPRVAYAVGRSVGNAVARNRLRRRLRAAVAGRSDDLRPDTAYLVSAGPRAAAMTPAELSRAVGRLLRAAAEAGGAP
jgi:ribonuclease P protein component